MEMRQEPQQRHRRMQTQTQTRTFDLLADADHQRLVNQVDGIAEKQGQTAVILERLTNYFQDHDRRIKALEDQPVVLRANSATDRQQRMNLALVIISLLALLFSILHGGPITIP